MQSDDVNLLKNQLNIARNEINKLRQQVRNLQQVQRKDIEALNCVLGDFRCEGCRLREQQAWAKTTTNTTQSIEQNHNITEASFQPIGIIRTDFPEKRAVPRQSCVGGRLRGLVELNSQAFNNPEHALEGLSEYSHLWLIYQFHRNNAHPKAKVAPPRLGGERVGVFSTRSPHRPCPIGLSLVEIDKIEGASISFYGTDMVDGTPLLDIKPYIPFYDAPLVNTETDSTPTTTGDFYTARQEPDGEESELELLGATAVNQLSPPAVLSQAVKVPNWVVNSQRLLVLFNERSEAQLQELQVEKQSIIDILEADPRSVYLRTKYGSQIFTFQLGEVTVTCKFDDRLSTVKVLQVRRTENVQAADLSQEVTNN